MTKEQAFKEWMKKAEQFPWGYDDLWNAACAWQKMHTTDMIKWHLNSDKDGDFFLTKESYKDLFEND